MNAREIHIHHDPSGARWVQSRVDGQIWKSLPFEAPPGIAYNLMKVDWGTASLHRQWGKDIVIDWVKGLLSFYQHYTGVLLGVGDISHIVGEAINGHGSHRLGRDVDLYVLDYPPGSPYPEAYFCDGSKVLTLASLAVPKSAAGSYGVPGALITGGHAVVIWRRYATVLAYCICTWDMINAFTWHGVPRLEAEAVRIAQAVYSSGWRPASGPWPGSISEIPPASWPKRSAKLVGAGSPSYGTGWPPHHDHIHVRLNS
jgi:hypothetical protein